MEATTNDSSAACGQSVLTDGLAGTQRLPDVEAAGHRLALELECLLLDTKDLPTVSRWWDSGMQALEEWQRMFPYNGPRLGD